MREVPLCYTYPDGTSGVLLESYRADLEDQITKLRGDDKLSGVTVYIIPQPFRELKEAIAHVADLLKSYCKIFKKLDATYFHARTMAYVLFEALSTGQAGDNLKSLEITGTFLRDDMEIMYLESYLRRNLNLKRFDIHLDPAEHTCIRMAPKGQFFVLPQTNGEKKRTTEASSPLFP